MSNSSEKVYRSKQVGVYLTEDLFNDLKKIAAMDGTTYSHKAYQLIKKAIEERKGEIEAYDEFLANLRRK